MRVIIVGASKVGYALTKHICEEGYDVIVIDKDAKRIDEVTDAFDCNGFVGNGSDPELLKKAGIDSTSLFIAVTKDDEVNLLCCSVAKKLGVKRTIASMRTPQLDHNKEFYMEQMDIDVVFNPEKSAASEANKLIRYAGALQIEHFDDGNVNVASVNISEDSVLAGATMLQVRERLNAKVLICAIERADKIITPKGKHQIHAGDKITIAADDVEMDKALASLNIVKSNIRKTVIVGGSKVGYYLTELLLKQGIKVTFIDSDTKRCAEFLEQFPSVNVVNGDGTNSELLEKELKDADACVAVTGDDEINLIISMFVKSFGMKRVATEIDNEKIEEMLYKSGIDHVFSSQNLSLGNIIRDTRQLAMGGNSQIKWLHTLFSDNLEAVELEVDEDFALTGIEFKNPKFTLKAGILIAVIIRGETSMIPDGNSTIEKGDRIIIVSAEHKIAKISDIVA